MLRASAELAGVVAGRLREREDWQYAAAVALRAHADDYARHLARHLRAERIDEFACRLPRHAALCTRELAPIAPLWEQAGVLAWQMRAMIRPRSPFKEPVRRALQPARARPSASFSPHSLLRALFVG
ncbi:MAG TPA: hypothetical protein VFD76_08580 [Gemmatimonadales bacterium]|nr:hypothetical protein [Gemmatimonadales bacterium]